MPHGHSHGGHDCAHQAADTDHSPEMGVEYSLFSKIDMENLECLNEERDGSGKTVFKSYDNRLDHVKYVQSDSDQELLFNIPFSGHIKLKGLIISGANDSSHPSKVRIFKNRPKMCFDDVVGKPDQEFELSMDSHAEIEYPTKIVTFNSVHHLSLHFPNNFGCEHTRIYYIGLKGEFKDAHYHGVTICNYEARPNMADHKDKIIDSTNHAIQ